MRNQLWRSLHRSPHLQQQFRHIADARPFQPGDLVLLREKLNKSAQPIFTRPLKAGGKIEGHRGIIPHDDIVGKRVRDVVRTAPPKAKAGGEVKKRQEQTEFRVHEVKLEEYVRLTKRLVTPVYPVDAALIVDLLDLHSHAHEAIEGGEKLEVLEAGTGHGALTLYLSRAIHAANMPLPRQPANEASVETWKANRKAIIHTVDTQAKYSAHAQSIVKGFKHGLYAHNVDFHTSDVSAWVRKNHTGDPFLSRAILDLPNADTHLAIVAQAMRTDGTVVVFNPSLTQILQCCVKIKEEGTPLELESVIELPVNGGARGREWDVRAVKPRASIKKDEDHAVVQEEVGVDEELAGTEQDHNSSVDAASVDEVAILDARAEETPEKEGGWQMVCRPKVGDRIVGGGFLGVLKKQRDMRREP
ncbi:hypothetical protein LTR37_003888 [Vermiconidia calcicola]|uniref:Uncharacterized protein n=1 Tax=Vermiconidia calcicola TaxID=1690605 RepID=A0ACC3NNM1_9PEZI|nr:hypothetical protein LTR37_003888 [Vermiconidia calcicola]